jgi:heme exporter protein CcmD
MLPYVWTAYVLTALVFAVMIGGTLALGRSWRRRAGRIAPNVQIDQPSELE